MLLPSLAGITGAVRIDTNGDRDADYSLRDFDPVHHKFITVALATGSSPKFTSIPTRSIHWPGNGKAPPDIPKCGLLGDNPECSDQGSPFKRFKASRIKFL